MGTHKCRCGAWTNYGLTCTRCQSEMFDYLYEHAEKERDSDDEEVVEVPLSEYESDEDD